MLTSMNKAQKPQAKPSDQPKNDKLAQALRDNLKRRKAGPSGRKSQKKADSEA